MTGLAPTGAAIGRILRSADFERVLGTPTRARSAHFAVHYLASRPSVGKKRPAAVGSAELSTGQALSQDGPVDDSALNGLWVGTVVPKRHAKRSVTRNLLKRQIHHAVKGQSRLAHGLWVIRLRSPFDKKIYPSAASTALQEAAAAELLTLMARASQHVSA